MRQLCLPMTQQHCRLLMFQNQEIGKFDEYMCLYVKSQTNDSLFKKNYYMLRAKLKMKIIMINTKFIWLFWILIDFHLVTIEFTSVSSMSWILCYEKKNPILTATFKKYFEFKQTIWVAHISASEKIWSKEDA